MPVGTMDNLQQAMIDRDFFAAGSVHACPTEGYMTIDHYELKAEQEAEFGRYLR